MSHESQSLIGDLDARFYKNHSSLQYKLAHTLLQDYRLNGNESILDIGCGDGKITAELSLQAPEGHVVGIDISASMIDFALQNFPQQKFPNLRFEHVDACTFKFNASFDLITSFSCLHWIKNQKQVLLNIKHHLKPQGKTLIVTFPRCKNFWDPIEAVAHSSKWRKYFKPDLYPYHFLDEAKYKKLFKEVGLNIDLIETTSHVTRFPGKEGFENYVKGWLPFLLYLPNQLHQEFLNEIGNKSLEFIPVQDDGYVYHPYEKIVIFAQRN
jgi:trans-aconitate methyltransferase